MEAGISFPWYTRPALPGLSTKDLTLVRQTVTLDFDGVLHSYASGWKGFDLIPDPPVDGAKEFCEELLKHYDVIILSVRCGYEGGSHAITKWLTVNEFPSRLQVSPTGVKVPSILAIDDRAFCFRGTFPTIDEIKTFKPWNKP